MSEQVRLYLSFQAEHHPGLLTLRQDLDAGRRPLVDTFAGVKTYLDGFFKEFDLQPLALPSLGEFVDDDDVPRALPPPPEVEVALDAMPREQAERLLAQIVDDRRRYAGIRGSADLAIAGADVWCPGTATSPLFGDLDHALALIGADALGANARGRGVRVIIVDQGLDKDYFKGNELLNRHGKPRGWTVKPNTNPAQPDRRPGEAAYGHGTRVAQLVLKLAPEAKLYDLPLLPDRIRDLPNFLSLAKVVMYGPLDAIHGPKPIPGPWVLCNAWSVYSLSQDLTGSGNYGTNPSNTFTRSVADITAASAGRAGADVVFAAGNCGLYCPDGRCGSQQIGPGRSIYGVAALDQVLTVGAVRNDRTWLGYSSEGPRPAAFVSSTPDPNSKPDLCAPSQFADPVDARIAYTGTSAACALAAGAIAALRDSRFAWKTAAPSTPQMIAWLRDSALRQGTETQGDPRRGDGTLDIATFVARNGP